ncbi:MAG: hypothetical protein LC667_06520 [Thioalkalivibrio sp.]|nr:hypothetical protein [Thioalkalivibrio sp.]
MRKSVIALFFAYCLGACSLVAAQQGEAEVVDGVLIMTSVDAFTDDRMVHLFIAREGRLMTEATSPSDGVMMLECENGSLTGMVITFREYLDNGGFGTFEYRADGGAVHSSSVWQDGSRVVLFYGSLAESRPNDPSTIRTILASQEVAVRATGYDGDTAQAVYYPASLRSVLTNHVRCAY